MSKPASRLTTWLYPNLGPISDPRSKISLGKLDRALIRTAKLDSVKVVFCLLLTESVLMSRLKQIFIQAMNYGVFLYEIYTIMLPTLEEGSWSVSQS